MKGPMRILMPTIYFPPRIGGIENHVYYLARELVRRGHSVDIVTTRTEKASPASETMDGIRVERIHSFGKHPVGWVLSSLLAVPRVVGLAGRCDVIHCHTFAFALSGSVANFLKRTPLVVTVHESHFLRFAKRKAMRPLLRLPLARAAILLSTSKEIDCGHPGPAAVGPHPAHRQRDRHRALQAGCRRACDRSENEFVIVCPRRLVEKNGVEFLVRAVPLIAERLNVKVYLAGDGPLRESSRPAWPATWVSPTG